MGAIAVTGAAGYVGGRVVQQLRAAGHAVRPLARHEAPWMSEAVLIDLARAEVDVIRDALRGCTAVVHLAGASEVHAARDPDGSLATTVAAARRVAHAAAGAGVERLVYLSTVHVYGAALDRQEVVDETVVPEPRHPYAVARLAGEHLVAAADLGSAVVLRLTNSVGAPLDPRVGRWTLVANDLCAQAASGGPLQLRSSGLQWRDFVDLGEVCRIIETAAVGHVPGGTYNLGSGRSRTVLELTEVVADVAADLLGTRPRIGAPAHEGPLPAEVHVDISRLSEHVAPPGVPLDASVRELIELCLAADDRERPTADG